MIEKKIIVLAVTFIVLLFIGCKKTVTDTPTHDLVLHLEEGYNRGQSWVIIHSLDGKKAIRCFPLTNKTEIRIRNFPTNTVTFSLITTGLNSEFSGIQSFYQAPTGTWKFVSSKDVHATMTLDLNLTFPENGESRLEVFTNFSRSSTHYIHTGDTTFHYSDYISQLSPDTTLSIFCYLFNSETNTGYYGWLLNQKIISGEQKDFSINLGIPFEKKSISIHKEFYTEVLWIELLADLGISRGELSLTSSFSNEGYNRYDIYFAQSFPADNYIIRTYIPSSPDDYYTSYRVFREVIPDEISIPSGSFAVLYGAQTFRNIQIEGDADAISAIWSVSGSAYYDWKVVVPPTTEMFSYPVLPDSIDEFVFGSNARDPGIQAITMHSYRNINGYRDYCQKTFMSGKPLRTFIDDQYDISRYNFE